MAANSNSSSNPSLSPNADNARTMFLPEIGPDGIPRESPVIAYTEKVSHNVYTNTTPSMIN